MSDETIERAALLVDSVVWSVPRPGRHTDVIALYIKSPERRGSANALTQRAQGFLTNTGRFVSRAEALRIARAAGQIIRRCGGDSHALYSENLW